jgi:hypothetical protein
MPEGKDTLMILPTENNSSGLVEVTTYIREDQALGLEMIQLAEQQSGVRCDQAALFQEALDMLINTRLAGICLSKKKPPEQEPRWALKGSNSE